MITKEFLEEYSLFRKFNGEIFTDDLRKWNKISINMKCHECNSAQTFNMTNNYWDVDYNNHSVFAKDRVLYLNYQCESCKKFEREFYVYVNESVGSIYKTGQYPEWEIKMDKNLEKTLNKHSKTFRKGLVCESQGYGIGAFAYYRRITEQVIDELLESITDLIETENKENYLAALEETKKNKSNSRKDRFDKGFAAFYSEAWRD